MDTIRLTATVGEDHRVIVDLPQDVPVGTQIELVIRSQTAPLLPNPVPRQHELTREEARAILKAHGKLSEEHFDFPPDFVPMTPDELLRIGKLPPGSPSLDDLINEDRGAY